MGRSETDGGQWIRTIANGVSDENPAPYVDIPRLNTIACGSEAIKQAAEFQQSISRLSGTDPRCQAGSCSLIGRCERSIEELAATACSVILHTGSPSLIQLMLPFPRDDGFSS